MLRIAPILLLGLAACASPSPTAANQPSPVTFALDLRELPPFLTISSTHEQLRWLNARFVSFKVYLGGTVENIQLSVQQAHQGPLILPWTIYLRNFSPPFPVRFVGFLPDGKQETVWEETFSYDGNSDL